MTRIVSRRAQADPGRRRDPHERGLEGHSDADVLAHAVIDALLGAAGLGDIGEHFPDTDERWRDADSMQLLGTVVTRLRAAGLRVVNVDCTVMMEQPKLGPHRQAIRERLASALGLEAERVNVKATTGEGIGFVGRGEGAWPRWPWRAFRCARRARGAIAEVAGAMRRIRLHDTRTGELLDLVAAPPDAASRPVGIYACGPTVYSRIHIGNARPFVVFSLLKRFLEHEGLEVTLVMNITDVNDKIYDAARAQERPSAELAAEMTELYRADTDALGLGRPTTSRSPQRRWGRSSPTSRP